MPVNPITLDKMEPVVIKQMENKVVDRLVHEIKGVEIQKDNRKKEQNFSREKQEKAAEQFSLFLSKYNIKLEYQFSKQKIKIKLRDKSGNFLLETEVEDMETLLSSIKKETGNIIDLKG